jgi:hypothetical protein
VTDIGVDIWPSAIEAAEVAEQVGIDWNEVPFDLDQFRAGLHEEPGRDGISRARIVVARLLELPDYYRRDAPWGPDGEHAPPP